MNETSKNILIGAGALLVVQAASTGYASETMYQITETELTRLEYNLMKLQQFNEESQAELMTLKSQLTESQEKLKTLKVQLTELQSTSRNQESLLQTASESLEKYAKEETRTRRRIKRQRNFAWCIAGCILIYAIRK